MKHLGTFEWSGVPEAAQNRIADITRVFGEDPKTAVMLLGIYVVLFAFLEGEWHMRPFTTSYRRGSSCEKDVVGKDEILRILSESDIPAARNAAEEFMN